MVRVKIGHLEHKDFQPQST